MQMRHAFCGCMQEQELPKAGRASLAHHYEVLLHCKMVLLWVLNLLSGADNQPLCRNDLPPHSERIHDARVNPDMGLPLAIH